jgi:hypothetical protein
MSSSLIYGDVLGRTVEIGSVRPDEDEFALLRVSTAGNLLFGYVQAVLGPDADLQAGVQRIRGEIDSGTRPWTDGSIEIDGEYTDLKVLDLGSDFWVALGRVHNALIAITSRGVPLEGLALVRRK